MTNQHNKTKLDIILVITTFVLFFNNALTVYAGTASLSWNTNSESDQVAGYKVYHGTTPGIYGLPTDVGNQTTYTVTELDSGTYYFSVTAYDTSMNESGFSSEVSKTISVSDLTPPVLSGMAAESPSSTEAIISWSTDEGATSSVEYGMTTTYGSFSTTNPDLATSHSQTLSDLTPSTTYNYRVISTDAAGNTATSGNFTFTTPAAVDITPPALSVITASVLSSTEAIISWSTDEGATSSVEYGITTAYGSFSTTNPDLTTGHSQTLSELAPSTTYNYRVISIDAAGNTAISGNFTLTTMTDASDSQSLIGTLIVASGASYEAVQNGLSDGALAYIDRDYTYSEIPLWLQGAAYIKTANEDKLRQDTSFLSFDVNQDVTVYVAHDDRYQTKPVWLADFSDTGESVMSNTSFSLFSKTFSVGPVTLGGNVNPLEIEEDNMYTVFVVPGSADLPDTPDTTPPVLSNIQTSNITNTEAVVTWMTSEGATSKVDFGPTTDYGASSELSTTLVTSHHQTLPGLSPATAYNYRIISTDAAGNEATSPNFVFITASNPDITSPFISPIVAIEITENSVTITWGSDEASTSQVEFGLTNTYGETTTLNQTLSNSHQQILSQLQPGVLYHYRVRSIDAVGNLSVSDDMTFVTLEKSEAADMSPPEEAQNFSALGKNRQILLSWENPLDLDFVGVRILYRTDHFPADINDGELLGDFSGAPGEKMLATHDGMENGITYYYLAATYDSSGNFESTVFVSATSGFESTGDLGDEESSRARGCGMIRPGGGKPPGPGQAAEMIAILGVFFLIWTKKGIRYFSSGISTRSAH